MTLFAMRTHQISFPGLGIGEFTVNSVAFSVFGFDIAWYALIITCGMVACVTYVSWRAKKRGISYDHILDLAIFTILFGVIGARLYYIATEWQRIGIDSFFDAINIRDGGLAIYGGIIAGGATVFLVCKFKKLHFRSMADMIYPGVMLAQAIGRWGNFMNAEAYGNETTLPWRMGINGTYYHPTFLYECIWNLIGFTLINVFFHKKKYDGQLYYFGAAWYGFGRMFIEMLRTDSMMIGDTRTNLVLGAAAFVIFTTLLIYNAIKKTNTLRKDIKLT